MAKTISMDDLVLSRFKEKFGEEASPEQFAIYKVKAISTEPLRTPGRIFDGGHLVMSVITEMCDIVNNTRENIGVHVQHNSMDLNIGRVFSAEVQGEMAYMYLAILNNDENKSIIEKLDTNVLDEVSVSVKCKKLLCSKCGFDYYGDEATFENWMEHTCNEGHTVGVDGCYVIGEGGVDYFEEVSIVNQGAARQAKVIGKLKQRDVYETPFGQLAAAKGNSRIFAIQLTQHLENETMEEKEEIKQEEAPVEEVKEEETPAPAEEVKEEETPAPAEEVKEEETPTPAPAEEVKEEETPTPAPAEEADAELKKELEETKAELEKVKAELQQITSEKAEVLNAYRGEVKKVMVALNKTDVEVPENLDGISKLLNDSQATLAAAIPVGGLSQPAMKETKTSVRGIFAAGFTKAQLSAFQVEDNNEV